MREKAYVCDDCGKKSAFSSYIKARKAHWAVTKDYKRSFCPECAPAHRRGAAMIPRGNVNVAEDNQLTIDEIIGSITIDEIID